MQHDIFLKKYISLVLVFVLFIYTFSAFLPVSGEEALYDKILRLHVIANSDSKEDQEMKLFVRDSILCELEKLYKANGVADIEAAKALIDKNRALLLDAAQKAVYEYDPECDYKAELELTRASFPTKAYEDITLPAGVYDCVRIKIGKAKGQNWWCVLFPTLCLSSATVDNTESTAYVYEENGEKFIAAGFTPQEIRIITESDSTDVKIKFRLLEIFGSLFDTEG